MENNIPNTNSTNIESINLREVFIKYLLKWHWFLISIVICFIIAYFYLKITNDQFQVQSTILIRKDKSTSGLLDMSMLDGLGGGDLSGSSKEVEDEIQVLTSKTLMTNMIKSLGIETEYFEKNGFRYEEIYPLTPLKLITPQLFNDTAKKNVIFKISRIDVGYKIDFVSGKYSKSYEIAN